MDKCHNIIFILILECFYGVVLSQTPNGGGTNNVCPRYRDYYNMQNNENCWHNFAAEATVPEIIQKTGYPFQEYKVRTKDGYILTVFRIPSLRKDKGPVFLMHGVQSTSGIFVGIGKDSLAFVLSDAGYDVWLGNYRGTEYSEGHTHLNISSREYWNYGVDEISLIDLPSMLNLVRYHTYGKGKITYIGHSLGTTTALMYASEYPDHAKDTIKLCIFMAPAFKLTHMRSPYRLLLPLMKSALSVTNRLNLVQIFSRGYSRRLTQPTCLSNPSLMLLCLNGLNLFLGPFTQIAPETIPVLFSQLPGGTSLKTLTYLTDSVRGRFQKFDYGGRNMFMYGNSTPPAYDINRVQIPIFIFYAAQDWATSKPACEVPTRQNEHSHYVCDDDGEVKCLPGWAGDLCDVPKCRPGCDPLLGYCNRPGECLCKLGYFGDKCNKCIPLPGCQHGYCNASFECVCHEGWDGIFCGSCRALEG